MFGFHLVRVKEQSMEPTLNENDLLLIKTSFKNSNLHRNDVIIFKSPVEKNLKLVKRVIGISGDIVQIYSNGSLVLNNNEISSKKVDLEHDWIEFEWNIGPSQIIILSDNREKKHDSRYFGPIDYKDVIGKVVFSIKPFRKVKKIFL